MDEHTAFPRGSVHRLGSSWPSTNICSEPRLGVQIRDVDWGSGEHQLPSGALREGSRTVWCITRGKQLNLVLPSAAGETDVGGGRDLACGRCAVGCRSDSRFRAEPHATQSFYDKISKQGVSETQAGMEEAWQPLLPSCCYITAVTHRLQDLPQCFAHAADRRYICTYLTEKRCRLSTSVPWSTLQ